MAGRDIKKSGHRRPGLPSPEALIEFLRDNPGAVGTREIGRAFGLRPTEQPALRNMLRRVGRSGELTRAAKVTSSDPI